MYYTPSDLKRNLPYIRRYQSYNPNPDKVRIYELNEPFDFLGFKCQGYNIDLSEATKRKMKDKIRRKTHSLLRWRSKENIAPETVMKTLIKHFNRKFYESDEPTMLTWSRWFFPLITSTTGLKDIDHYLQDNIRYLATGKHNKSRFRIRYEYLQQLGYRSLVHEYYAAKFS